MARGDSSPRRRAADDGASGRRLGRYVWSLLAGSGALVAAAVAGMWIEDFRSEPVIEIQVVEVPVVETIVEIREIPVRATATDPAVPVASPTPAVTLTPQPPPPTATPYDTSTGSAVRCWYTRVEGVWELDRCETTLH